MTNPTTYSETELLDDLRARGIAPPVPSYPSAGDPCRYSGCDRLVPENTHRVMNLGLQDGYCSLGCLLAAEADDAGDSGNRYREQNIPEEPWG